MNPHILKRGLIEGFTHVGTRHVEEGQPSHDTYRFGRTDNSVLWGVVADGCSSSLFAREGAEHIADIAAALMPDKGGMPLRAFEWEVITQLAAKGYAQTGHYCSTLVTLRVTDETAQARFFGDGSLLFQDADGCWHEVEVEYGKSSPRFLHYFAPLAPGVPGFSRDTDEWRGALPKERACVVTYRKWVPGGISAVVREEVLEPNAPLEWLLKWQELDIVNIMVCTDGVLSSSMPRVIREQGQSFGFEQLMKDQFAAREPGFFLPNDDATFINMALRG